MKFSPSKIRAFGDCALNAKFKYVDNLPTKTGSSAHWGTSLHHALEQFAITEDIDLAIEEFIKYYDSVTPDYWNRRTNYTGQKDMGKRILEDFAETDRWTHNVPVGAEFRFMVDIGEHQLSGIIDLLEVTKDLSEVIITDYKSGARPNLDNLHLNIQMTAYDFASKQKEFWTGYPGQEDKYPGVPNGEEIYEKLIDVPRKVIWYDLKKNQAVDVGPRGDRDYARMYRAMEQIARAIEHEVFIPSISGDNCGWCDFQDICPVYFDKEVPVDL